MATLAEIYDWFMTSKKPTQAQFWASWGSFWNKNESIPQSAVSGLTSVLNAKVENDQFNAHKGANDAHAALFNLKQDLDEKGQANGYVPLNEFVKIAYQYLSIVDDLETGGSTALASAETVKTLKGQIDVINLILTSDDVDLDTVQEIVDAIKEVETSLQTILVNDLTTGGTTKALTAEMGKQLDLIKESTANKSTSFVVDYLSNIKFPSVKAVYDFCMSAFKKKFLTFGDVAGIAYTFGVGSENTMFKFSNNNPITATIPTNATTPFEIGTVFETIAIGNGALTVTGAPGVTILTNLSNTSIKNEVRRYTKIDTDTWTVEGNIIDDSQIEVSANTTVLEFWNKRTILFTANCTITVPATLLSQYGFVFRTLAGVTVTWAITAPFTWETTPTTTPEKTTGSFMRRGNTNTILLDF